MNQFEFSLFRVKIEYPEQGSFFHEDISRPQVLFKALEQKPELVLKQTHRWHIGNLRNIEGIFVYFRIGRTTKSTREKFDRSTMDFIEHEDESSPFSHVIVNLQIGVMAVSKKISLAKKPTSIAKKLEKLLLSTRTIIDNELRLTVAPIPDPVDFISALENAYAVKSFTFSFRSPNPVDIDALFHKPLQRLVAASDGEKGKTALKGDALNAQFLAKLTASVAAAGDNADAQIQTKKGARSVRKSLKKSPAVFTVSEEDAADQSKLTETMMTRYQEVRHADEKG